MCRLAQYDTLNRGYGVANAWAQKRYCSMIHEKFLPGPVICRVGSSYQIIYIRYLQWTLQIFTIAFDCPHCVHTLCHTSDHI